MAEVGKAYITVTPKLDSGNLASTMPSAGKSAGAGFGGAFSVAAGTLIANALSNLASAVGDTFSKAFSNYANYEQLIGGVDTLFKESSAIVQENAAKAFETAGMSANEYMENVTSFSASLLQGLGGDTEKAAAYADMAMRDMSDNANKMGTDMGRITDAYQGFAKQNYTMLDNLKLGYGGTKTEMERLLADASKIAGVEFNIDNYNDVIEAIHIMQEEMGIAGTTALEGSATISGSISKLSASWDNFLTGLFDESADMGALGENLFKSLGDVIKNVVPRIGVLAGRAILDLPKALMSAFMAIPGMIRPTLEEVFGESIGGGIADMMTDAFTQIQSIITDTMMPAAQVVVEFAQTVFTAITPVVKNVWSLIQQAFPIIQGIITAAMNFISNLMQTAWPIIGNIVSTVVGGISQVIDKYWPAIQSLITSVMTTISTYIQTGWELISTVVSVAMNVIGGIIETVWPAIQTIIDVVMGAILGVIETVWPVISGIVETAINVIKVAIDGVKVVVGWVTDTFNSVKEAILGPIEAARDAVQGIIDAIVGFFDGLGNRITSAIGTITMPSISGSANVNGEQIAYVDIGWQAQGGILTNATLIGAGEAGAEAIIPLTNHQYVRPFAQTVAEEVNLMGGGEAMLIAWLSRNLGTIIADNAPSLSRRDFDRMARTAVAR